VWGFVWDFDGFGSLLIFWDNDYNGIIAWNIMGTMRKPMIFF
jgi:hypothetical protein